MVDLTKRGKIYDNIDFQKRRLLESKVSKAQEIRERIRRKEVAIQNVRKTNEVRLTAKETMEYLQKMGV